MRRGVVAVAIAVLMSSCGGPKIPFQVVGKAVPVNVKFGKGLPDVTVQPVPGGYIIVPQPIPPSPLGPFRFPPLPPPRPVACPTASPLSFPERAATNEIFEAPKGATYVFRTGGTRTVDGVKHAMPLIEERQVGNIETSEDPATGEQSVRFTVRAANANEVVITSYVSDSKQLAISGIARFAGGVWKYFSPPAPLRILPIPPRQTLVLGNHLDTWQSAAADPVTQTSASVDGKVVGQARIDACGKVVDSWLAELKVRWVSPTDDYTTVWRINVATQYGGLIIAESVSTEGGTKDGKPFEESRTARITRVPAS